MTTRYANDPRVVQTGPTRYEIPSPQGWAVMWHPLAGEWRAVAENELYGHPEYWPGKTAGEAIHKVIGEPQ